MHRFSTNYRERGGSADRLAIVNRGFWVHDLPRPLLICRLFGHKPVVDGVGTPGENRGHVARWVCCDRCGERPRSQGRLDPHRWNIGDTYTGEWGPTPPPPETLKRLAAEGRSTLQEYALPGSWPDRPTWTLGGQVIIGRTFTGCSAEVKVGNGGSEHTLAAHIRLNPLGALYLNTERLGTWIQRRLNPTGYESRVIGLAWDRGRLSWKLWAKRDMFARGWTAGEVNIDPRDRLLGPKRYSYEDVGVPQTATVAMPHGDSHEAMLQLQRCTFGRRKGRKKLSWSVDWETRPGIPTENGNHGRILGSGVTVDDAAVQRGIWPEEAAAKIALKMTETRARQGYKPPEDATQP